MKNMSVCKCCGRTIENEFVFCPWCGESRLEPEDKKSMDVVFEHIVELQNRNKDILINQMKDRLDVLDKELSNLVLSVEMHR